MKKLPWEKLKDCNILITGATGLIGSALVDALMLSPHKDFHVYALGRNAERAYQIFKKYWDEKTFHFLQHDVTQPMDIQTPFHYIIDAASNASPNFFVNHPVEVMLSNILGVHNLIQYGIEHDMHRFLYISSGEVYGQSDRHIITEDYCGNVSLLSSRSCYPNSKRAAETLCASYIDEYGIDAVIVRPCHVYGPGFTEQDNRVYAQFIRKVLQEEDIVLKSTGEQIRSWCYIEDCTSAILYTMFYGISGEAYNVADDSSTISIRQLADMIAEICNKTVKMESPSTAEKKEFNPVKRSVISTQKLQSLGWELSEGTMKEKIEKTIRDCYKKKQ